jgi:hypothetical protein
MPVHVSVLTMAAIIATEVRPRGVQLLDGSWVQI